SLLYSSYLGGNGNDFGKGVAVDNLGSAYIAGQTGSNDLLTRSPSGQNLPPFQAVFQGGFSDAFVAKVDTNSSGSASLVYLTYFGGNGTDRANAIAVDSSQRAYITGASDSSAATFPLINAFQTTQAGGDAFVAKFNADATALFYSSLIGGDGGDESFGIVVD